MHLRRKSMKKSINMSSTSRWLGGVVLAALIVLAFGPALKVYGQFPGVAQGKWTKAATFPEPEEELYGVAAGGKMYVLGGFGVGGKPVGMNWQYDPASDKWTKMNGIPLPVHHAGLAVYHDKIYMFGGYILNTDPNIPGGGWEPVDNAWQFDPVANSWKALAPLPGKRGSPIAEEVGGQIYVIGGAIPEPGSKEVAIRPSRAARSVSTNEAYDPETNKWTTRSPMPTPRNHAFAGTVNGKIYVIGGRITSPFITVASNLDIVEEYDPATNTWGGSGSRTPMPTARSGGGWTTYSGKIYVGGGEIQTRQMLGAFRALEAYDPATNSWSILQSMPIPRHGVATAVLNGKIHFVSGKITSGGTTDVQLSTGSHDVYDPN
jgi:N-acetylneuraminic acid mutarotase